ncbi:MFS transporter [Paraburkholderia sp. EG304]|uniref:MFS transporter n=1 Tax=Paraburkholderia sp. EG304 TaxID=3237015 RepID=UPI00397A8C81
MNTSIKAPSARQVAAAVIGNALECYDFVIFGLLTAIISTVFFPSGNEYASILLTTATFGAGFFMRPVGGILIAIYANRKGRKAAMQLIIAMMTIATALIAFTPSFAVIGAASSVVVVAARLLQGFATGGEFASSTALLVEMSPRERRGFYGSWMGFGQALCFLLGAGAGALITHSLSHDQLYGWGWRIPFMFGLLIAPVGYWFRRHVEEPNVERVEQAELPQGMRKPRQIRAALCGFFLTSASTIAQYVLVAYMPTFANKYLGIRLDDAFASQCLCLIVMIVSIPLFGALSDRIGRKSVLLFGLVSYAAILLPLFGWLVSAPSFLRLVVTLVLLSTPVAMLLAVYAPAMAEQFTFKHRSLGLAISYNIAVLLFGGFAQLIITWILHTTGSMMTPAYYLLVGAGLGIVGSLLAKAPATESNFVSDRGRADARAFDISS